MRIGTIHVEAWHLRRTPAGSNRLLSPCIRDIIFILTSEANRRSPMKKLTVWLVALAALQGTALQAQNLTGSWQGTLEVGQRKVRLVFMTATAEPSRN
jgi:hypothetical protein